MLGEILLLVASLDPTAKVLAKSCSENSADCQLLVVDGKEIRLSYGDDPSKGAVVGPYLGALQPLVAPTEAPTQEIRSARGWRVIITRGFDTNHRMAGSIFYIYFVDPSGVVRKKAEGDLFLEDFKIGDVFGIEQEVFLVTMRGETGISYTTSAWTLPVKSDPRELLSADGQVETIRRADKGRPAAITLGCLAVAAVARADERWGSCIWEWRESKKVFVETSRK